jgi:hypothetical protein
MILVKAVKASAPWPGLGTLGDLAGNHRWPQGPLQLGDFTAQGRVAGGQLSHLTLQLD